MRRLLSRGAAAALAGCALLFAANRMLEAAHAAPAAARGWLDDGLVLPLALGTALVLHRLRGRSAAWTLPPGQVLLGVALLGVVFEWLLPLADGRATADPLDLAAYAAGGGVFATLINRPARKDPA